MANINDAFVIEDGLAFDETQTGIFAGANDPTTGEAAPVGSLYIRTDGSVYIKTGAADTEWKFVLRQGDVTFDGLAPTTTKGDLIVRTVSSNVRLAVGPDNYVLVADATQPSGVKWAPVPSSTQITLDTGEPTGFLQRGDSVIAFNNSTRTFTISPTVTSFDVYLKGTKYSKTAAENIVIPNTSGMHFIYYAGGSCTLTTSMSPWSLEDVAPIALIYWNAVQGKNVLFGEERHGIVMDWATHEYLHKTRGTQYAGGFALNPLPPVGGIGDSDDEAQVDIDPGTMYDEDIQIAIVDSLTPSAQFEQHLTGPAKIPMFYKLGADPGIWYRDTATNFPLKMGTTYPYWNENAGGTWQLTEVAGGGGSKFITTWIVATHDVNEPVIGIVGQTEYSSLTQAQSAEGWTSIIASNLPFNEMRPIWRLIYEVKNNFTNTVKATIRDATDLREISVIQVAGASQADHGALTGLADDDHLQYVHTSIQRSITAQHQFAPSTASAPFILGANAQGQLVTGLNADLLDGQHASAFQPVDADLTALAGLTTNGIATRTADGSWSTRSVAGTAGQIAVTNGDGVAGNPTIALATAGTAGTYGTSTAVPSFTTDAYGRVTSVAVTSIAFPVTSVFGRTGAVVAQEGDYSLNLLSDVTLSTPTSGQVLSFNGTQWINSIISSFADPGANGIVVRTALNTSVARIITAGTGITITNGDGVTSNPIITNAGATSVFGRTGAVTAQEGDYSLTLLGDVTITAPSAGQILQFTGTQWVNATAPVGSGTVTSVAAAAPAAGLTISGSPITSAGTLTFALANDLAAVEGLATTGLAIRTAADTWATRTIQGTANQIAVTNGAGTTGDPTLAIAANPIIPGTGSIQVPSGTTAQRTSPASNGMIRFNTTTNNYEVWIVDKWVNLSLFSSGGVYQINAYLGDIPPTSGTSAVPFDNTTPLSTEGTQIWTRTVTPASTSSTFVVECPMTVDIGTSNRVLIVSIFRDTVNIGSALFYSTGGGRPTTLSLKVNDAPASAGPITYSMRAGIGAGSGTWYVNSNATGNNLGSALISQYEIREFAQ